MTATPPPDDYSNATPELEFSHGLRGASDRLNVDDPPFKMNQANSSSLTRMVEFPGDRGPLGIHVVPYCSSLSGRTLGLHIKSIEENSRSKRENLFHEDECIVQINDTPLQDKTFTQSQEVFRQAMTSSALRLDVLPVANKLRYEKSLIGHLFTSDGKDSSAKAKSPMVVCAKADSQQEPKPDSKLNTKLEPRRPDTRAKTPEPAAVNTPPAEIQFGHSSLERSSPTPPARATSSSPSPRTGSQSPLASKSSALPSLASLTNKKGGKLIKIDLKKGAEGLGFTVVTRDSGAHMPGPILVKNILPRGAAVKDGRLQPGDLILEVNGADMTGCSQEELVGMLRSTKQGESVCVVVARQEDIFLPREMKGENTNSLLLEDGKEQLMYEIPLNETGSAGLGVSLKGNKSRETGEDLGIFIKSVIHGGAAYKDGRLNVNDQLIAVNGQSLLGHSNHTAMETLRRSMSSEGNARGTIQLVVLRSPRQEQQMGSANPAPSTAANISTSHQTNTQTGYSNQEPRGHDAQQKPSGPSRPAHAHTQSMNAASHIPVTTHDYAYSNSGSAPYPAATTNGSNSHYGNKDEELGDGFPPPPSPGAMEEINRSLPPVPPHHSDFQKPPHTAAAFYSQLANDEDNMPRNRASKSMDMVADESNVGSLVGQRSKPSADGALGPTLGLWMSSSLESLQSAVSEAKQSHSQAQVPFHRPRPHVVRGRGCNQSFRIAIDKSYDGPSEDDDDLSEQSSGHETPVSSSSRLDLDAEDGKKKKKTRDRNKGKKTKGKKKTDEPKKKGFGLLRFGKKKEDKSKDATKASKSKLEALSEEEVDRVPDNRDGYDLRYADIHSGHTTPDLASIPDVEDDDSDPNYARVNFRQPPSPQTFISRTPSPATTSAGPHPLQASTDDLDGLYAKVNKPKPSAALQNQYHTQADSDQRFHGLRREYQQPRAAPVYEELDAARRRFLENDLQRMAPRGADPRPARHYEDIDQHQYHTVPRRDPYDYATHSRPREPAPYPGKYQDPPTPSRSGHAPLPTQAQQASSNPQHYPPSPHKEHQHRKMARQDVPPSPTAAHRGRQYYEAAGGRADGYRGASPGRYTYQDEKQPDPRRKNPAIGAV